MKKIHYAWAICLACTLLMFCNIGLSSNVISVYLPFIEAEGISGSQGSAIITVRCVAAFVSSFFAVAYYKKLSLRTGSVVAMLICAVSSLTYALAGNNVYVYYAASVLAGTAYSIGSVIPMSVLTENWFCEHKGLAVGIATTGSGICNLVFVPAITYMVVNSGLKLSYMVQTVFTLVCAVLVFALVRDNPQSMGLKRLGEEKPDAEPATASPELDTVPYAERGESGNRESGNLKTDSNRESGSLKTNSPDKIRILPLVMLFILGAVGAAGSGHLSIVAVNSGYSSETAALFITIYSLVLIAGKFLCGEAADVLGVKKTSLIFFVFIIAGCMSTCLMDGKRFIAGLIFALFIGLGFAVFNIGMTLWAVDFSTPATHKRTVQLYQILYSAGGMVFSGVPGIIADRTGEYQTSYIICAAMTLVTIAVLIICYRKQKQKI